MTRRIGILAAIVAWALLSAWLTAAASAAPSDADIRACVERNGTRYSNPGSAVDAQYADVETACRAALEDGATAQFTPDGGNDRSGAAAGGNDSPGGGGPATGAGSGSPAAPASGGGSPGASGAAASGGNGPAASADAAADPASVAAVRRAVAGAAEGTSGPLPSSLSGSGWMVGMLAAAGLLIGVAAVLAARRRPS